MKSWVNAVSSKSNYEKNLERPDSLSENPLIHFCPAIILRKRTERSLLKVYHDIVNILQTGGTIPPPIEWLVTDITSLKDASSFDDGSENKSNFEEAIQEIYFPLPTNDQQRSIAEKIGTRRGILVQGPPGTGKSHTITNLVCHLLAQGKRVLVTSHTARALSVLRNKFPQEFRSLCVSLLGDDRVALQGLEESVQEMTSHYNQWNAHASQKKIEAWEKELDEARREEARKLSALRAIREKDTFVHPPKLGNYEGTAQKIAARIREEEPHLGWIRTVPAQNQEPPLSNSEFKDLLHLWRKVTSERETELSKQLPATSRLPSPQRFSEIVCQESNAIKSIALVEALSSHNNYRVLSESEKDGVQNLATRLSDLLIAVKNVSQQHHVWVKEAAIQSLADRDRAWRELFTISTETIESIATRVREVESLVINGLEERDVQTVKADASELLSHFESKKGLGIPLFRPKVVKKGLYLIKEVHINGKPCNSPNTLKNLLDWIGVLDGLSALRKYWSDHVTDLPSGSFVRQVAEYRDLLEPLEKCLDLHRQVQEIKKLIHACPV